VGELTVWPVLEINLAKLKQNTTVINQQIESLGGSMFAVTKVVGGNVQVAQALLSAGAAGLADSRLQNIRKLRQGGITAPIMLLRSPALSEIEQVIQLVDISLNSEPEVLAALNREAERQGKKHQVLLMVDLGDGREGVAPASLPDLVRYTKQLSYLSIYGIGTNLACLSGAKPTSENMQQLVDLYQPYKEEVPYLSGCNSSGLHLVFTQQWPDTLRLINHWRIGESLFFGWDILTKEPLPQCFQDVCLLHAEVIEAHQSRAVVALGLEETGCGQVRPVDPRFSIYGVSSDHLVVKVKAGVETRVGQIISFALDYQSLLAAAGSAYVEVQLVL